MTDQTFASEISTDADGARAVRNPPWNYDETVLLLDLYLRIGCADKGHPEVAETSRLLRHLAAERGHPGAQTFRNPEGVSMRLKAMAQQDPEWRKLGLKGLRPVRIDEIVWTDLAGDPDTLAMRKAAIARAVAPAPQPSITRVPIASGEGGATPSPKSSHGPAPSFGWIGGERQDGDALLYLLQLEGPAAALFEEGRLRPPMIVAKIGRTNDVQRRMSQLSAGFPPASALRWSVVKTVLFASAMDAHKVERLVLDEIDGRGWSLGGEFLMAPKEELLQLIGENQNRAKTLS